MSVDPTVTQPLQVEDEWRFADATAKKLTKTVGAYGAAITPGTSIKSLTGTARGEELFHRPELYRPWRTPQTQRHAEAIVEKEHEIESLTKKNSELRTEVAVLNRELQRTQQKLKGEEMSNNQRHEREVTRLNNTIKDLRKDLDGQKTTTEHQMRVLRSEHEIELKDLRSKVKISQDAANDIGSTYQKQMQEVKNAAAREVQLIQQLSHARTAELQNELEAARDGMRRIQDRTNAMLSESQEEMRRSEHRCLMQLKEQEKRYEEMRAQLYNEIHALVAQKDSLSSQLAQTKEKMQNMTFEKDEVEARFKDWNVRLLSDLDQLHHYYAAIVMETEGWRQSNTHQAGTGATTVVSSSDTHDDQLKGVMERVAQRLQQLTALRQQHAQASQSLMKKIGSMEQAGISAQEIQQRAAEEKEIQLTRLYAETGEAKSKQARLEKAMQELKAHVTTIEAQLLNSAHRLQFFSEDLNCSLRMSGATSSQTNPPNAGEVTFVLTSVQGAAILWDAATTVMQSAMTICNDLLRAKMRQYGGYEFDSDSSSMLIAFHDPISAMRFCLEAQQWLVRARWPPELEEHHDARTEVLAKSDGEITLFRGLRVAMAVHHGGAAVQTTDVPIGIGEVRVHYHGRAVQQLLHLSSFGTGGQIIASAAAWNLVAEKLPEMGTPSVVDMGQHRLAIQESAKDGSGPQVHHSEMIGVLQLLPMELKDRSFSRDDTFDSTMTQQGAIVGSHLSQFRRTSIGGEVATLRKHYSSLNRAIDAVSNEMATVSASVNAVSCKLRDAQVHGRVYSQADIVAHIAALDRIVARTEVIKRDVDRISKGQKEHEAQVKALEDQLIVHTKVTMTEDEYKKKLELVHERCNEKLFEGRLQNEHQLQQLRNQITKADATINELRRQLIGANKADTSNVLNDVTAPTINKVNVGGEPQRKASSPPRQPTTGTVTAGTFKKLPPNFAGPGSIRKTSPPQPHQRRVPQTFQHRK